MHQSDKSSSTFLNVLKEVDDSRTDVWFSLSWTASWMLEYSKSFTFEGSLDIKDVVSSAEEACKRTSWEGITQHPVAGMTTSVALFLASETRRLENKNWLSESQESLSTHLASLCTDTKYFSGKPDFETKKDVCSRIFAKYWLVIRPSFLYKGRNVGTI
jgi:hypothetical protein